MANKEMDNLLDDIMIKNFTSTPLSEIMTEYDLTSDEIKIKRYER
jgi:hypothetical protein